MDGFRRVGIVVGALVAVLAVGLLTYQVGMRRGREEGSKEASARQLRSSSPVPSAGASPTASCGSTTLEIEECAQKELQRQEGTLDAVLRQVRAREGAARQKALDESQRQWTGYMATFCSGLTADRGSIGPANVASCKTELTHQRAVDVCSWFLPNADLGAVADPPEACRPLRR